MYAPSQLPNPSFFLSPICFQNYHIFNLQIASKFIFISNVLANPQIFYLQFVSKSIIFLISNLLLSRSFFIPNLLVNPQFCLVLLVNSFVAWVNNYTGSEQLLKITSTTSLYDKKYSYIRTNKKDNDYKGYEICTLIFIVR